MISFLNSANLIQYVQLSINYKKCLFKASIIYAVPKSVGNLTQTINNAHSRNKENKTCVMKSDFKRLKF